MSNVEVKEDFSHRVIIFGMLSDASFPSILVPNTPPFVPVTTDDISSVANSGHIAVILPQSSGTFPLYLFFPFVDGKKQDALHLIFYCMPQVKLNHGGIVQSFLLYHFLLQA